MNILREQDVYVLWQFIDHILLNKSQKQFWNSFLFSGKSSIPSPTIQRNGHIVEGFDARVHVSL